MATPVGEAAATKQALLIYWRSCKAYAQAEKDGDAAVMRSCTAKRAQALAAILPWVDDQVRRATAKGATP